nr:phage tail protein [Gemmobacter sp.]
MPRRRTGAAPPEGGRILVDGMGWVWDRWVITGVEERKSLFMADGAPRKIEFTTSLKAYGSDLA